MTFLLAPIGKKASPGDLKSNNENSLRHFTNTNNDIVQDDEGPKDEDPETNEKNGRLYDKAGKIRKMKYEQVLFIFNFNFP